MNEIRNMSPEEISAAGELRRKKKRAKKLAGLISLAVILAVLAVVYAVAAPLLSGEKDQDQLQTETIAVASLKKEDIKAVSYKNGETGDTVGLTLDSGTSRWIYAADSDYPVKQTVISDMITALTSLTAEREITEPNELSEYGLDKPSLEISVTSSNGDITGFTVGSYNGYAKCYYLTVSGSASVFTVSGDLTDKFDYTLDELIELQTLPSSVKFVSYTVTLPDGTTNTYSDEALLSQLEALSLMGWEKYKPTDDEKAAFGLDGETAVTIKVTYSESKAVSAENSSSQSVDVTSDYTLRVGGAVPPAEGESGSTQRYLFYGDSEIVYTADSSILGTLISGVAPAADTDAEQ